MSVHQSHMTKINEQSFAKILLQDAIAATNRNRADDNQISRRDLVRSTFAAVEGLIWIFREHITDSASSIAMLQPDEKSVLSDEFYSVNEQGKVTTHQRFVSTGAAIRLCVRIASRMYPGFAVSFDDKNWTNFRRFIEIRNALTHPKRAEDIEVSTADIEVCLAALFWILDVVHNAMSAANKAIETHRDDFRRMLDELKAGDPNAIAEYEAILARFSEES